MWTLYEPKNRHEDAKTLADFFGKKFFGGKSKPSVPSTNETVFFIVEDSNDMEEDRFDKAA